MTIFDDLLASNDVDRILILELDFYDAGIPGTDTLRVTDGHKTYTEPGTSSPKTALPRLGGNQFRASRSIYRGNRNFGTGLTTFGNVELVNPDGYLDSYADLGWYGQSARLLAGKYGWSLSDFGQIYAFRIHGFRISEGYVRLELRGLRAELERPANETLTTSGGTIIQAAENRPQQAVYGHCQNVELPLIDDTNRTCLVHSFGEIDSVPEVRENGLVMTLTTNYTVDEANGEVDLVNDQAGTITGEVLGDANGSYVNKTADICKRIIDNHHPGLSSAVDTASITALNSAQGAEVGIVLQPEGSPEANNRYSHSLLNYIDDLMRNIGGYMYETRAGKLYLDRLDDPAVTADETFDEREIIKIEHIDTLPPVWRVIVGYRRNWLTQEGGDLRDTVDPEWRAAVKHDFFVEVASDASIKTAHPRAETHLVDAGFFWSQTDAANEASRLLTLHGVPRRIFRATVQLKSLGIDNLGKTVQLTYPRYGLDNGKNFRLIADGFDLYGLEKLTMDLWG